MFCGYSDDVGTPDAISDSSIVSKGCLRSARRPGTAFGSHRSAHELGGLRFLKASVRYASTVLYTLVPTPYGDMNWCGMVLTFGSFSRPCFSRYTLPPSVSSRIAGWLI